MQGIRVTVGASLCCVLKVKTDVGNISERSSRKPDSGGSVVVFAREKEACGKTKKEKGGDFLHGGGGGVRFGSGAKGRKPMVISYGPKRKSGLRTTRKPLAGAKQSPDDKVWYVFVKTTTDKIRYFLNFSTRFAPRCKV